MHIHKVSRCSLWLSFTLSSSVFAHEPASVCIFLPRLRIYVVDRSIMLLFSGAAIESVIRYGITTRSVKLKSQLWNPIRKAGKNNWRGAPGLLSWRYFKETVRKQSLKNHQRPKLDPSQRVWADALGWKSTGALQFLLGECTMSVCVSTGVFGSVCGTGDQLYSLIVHIYIHRYTLYVTMKHFS